MIFVVLIPLKIALLIWLMSQEWFWKLVGGLLAVGGSLVLMILIFKAFERGLG